MKEEISSAQQSNIIAKDEKSSIEASFSIMVKEAFSQWLSDGHAKNYPSSVYLSCIDKVSVYLMRRKISSIDLWQITNFELFKSIYNEAINDRLFKVTDKKTYFTFIQVGQAFLKFLKNKPILYKNPDKAPAVTVQSSSKPSFRLTIKEAIIRVLENERSGMTVEQIYNKIIANGLYSFGAKNPQGVVRVELERACEKTNYTLYASKKCFRFERNEQGNKVYFLLSTTPTNDTAQPGFVVNEPIEPRKAKNEPFNAELWNDSRRQNFQNWMESEDYAPSTARNYCSAVNRTFKNFKPLTYVAINQANTLSEAIRKFVNLLKEDSEFNDADRAAHNQFSVALSVLVRFVDSDVLVNTAMADTEVKSIKLTTIDESVKSAVVSILEQRFPNGIRPNSIIDINKLKYYFREAKGEDILSKIIDIPYLLNSIGIRHGEKVFAIPLSGKKELTGLLNRLIAENNRLFYYEEFYEIHADFLQEINIFSPELLKTVLLDAFPSLHYSRNSFSTGNNVTVVSELLRCYETAICLSYEQLKSKLLYVPLDKIKQVLAQNSSFVWVGTGVYTHTSRLEIDLNEWHTIEKKIETELTERRYVSLASLNVSASRELNPELSETAVKNGLFQVYLANQYEKRGNIITPKGTVLNSVAVLEDYCLTHDCLTLDELFEFEKEINGSVHSQSLLAAYDNMIRVDKDTFVSDGKITFDIQATDNVLALFINAEVIPLRAVTSFTSFPYIEGYSWNLFLLESYCRRFSKQFKFQCLSVNSRNVGAIFRNLAGFADYTTVLATAVANASVELAEKKVGDFLFDSGYIARRTGVISDVIAKARILRERIV